MSEYIELIDKYRIVQSKDTDYNPPSYDWVDNTGEIVRCKDCEYYQNDCGWCGLLDIGMNVNGFCSRGKREES